ncbi:hypothetical protein ACQJBY_042106 [Aegilops geniculata]
MDAPRRQKRAGSMDAKMRLLPLSVTVVSAWALFTTSVFLGSSAAPSSPTMTSPVTCASSRHTLPGWWPPLRLMWPRRR